MAGRLSPRGGKFLQVVPGDLGSGLPCLAGVKGWPVNVASGVSLVGVGE